jgi:hypothetical protein
MNSDYDTLRHFLPAMWAGSRKIEPAHRILNLPLAGKWPISRTLHGIGSLKKRRNFEFFAKKKRKSVEKVSIFWQKKAEIR